MELIDFKIPELLSMKSYPKQLYCDGNLGLLNSRKISIVGSRKPTKYSRNNIQKISSLLAKGGLCIVSGGAIGIDAIAHGGAGAFNTIAVLPCGIDVRYPAVNKNLLNDIQKSGLLLSQFDVGFSATPWSFVARNELVVALGEVLVVGEAEMESGTMRSVEFAQKMGKKIFVIPQRLGESNGTNQLAKEGMAEVVYDIEEFVSRFCVAENLESSKDDQFSLYCSTNPIYDDALAKYPQKLFEAELSGDIEIVNGRVVVL